MTTPETPEPTCATCGKPEDIPYHVSSYDFLEGSHAFKPAEAPTPAAPSAWDREVAQMYTDIIERGLHLKDGCSYDGDHPCTCYVKAHLDMVIVARAEPPREEGEGERVTEDGKCRWCGQPFLAALKQRRVDEEEIAAARAPGPAGGEALELLGELYDYVLSIEGLAAATTMRYSQSLPDKADLGVRVRDTLGIPHPAAAPVEPGGGG